MNRFHTVSFIASFLLILTGCNSKDNHETTATTKTPAVASHAPTVVLGATTTPTNTTDPTDIVSCVANPGPIKKFVRVQITYGLLDEAAFISSETGGSLPLTITTPVTKGDTSITVDSTVSLVDNQLLTYLGTNDEYSVAQVKSTTATTITLTEPVLYDLAANNASLWNFYDDASHPNKFGFRALADYGFKTAFDSLETNKVHALLGDSWFKRNGETDFADRLLEKLPSGSIIQNEGVGGHSLCGLLGRIDDVISNHNPNYIWISSSINDFFDEVTQEQYKARMQTLIGKIQAAGAIAIIMDPAPGPLNQATESGVTFTTLSQRYATQILDLLAEAE